MLKYLKVSTALEVSCCLNRLDVYMILNKVTKHLELNKYIKNDVKCYFNKASVDAKSLCVSSIPSISVNSLYSSRKLKTFLIWGMFKK